MKLAREYHTPIDYFINLPVAELWETIQEHNLLVDEMKAANNGQR